MRLIYNHDERQRFGDSLPAGAEVALLVQNAAIGDPAPLSSVSPAHLEEALRVNVVAPLALTQACWSLALIWLNYIRYH